MILLRLALAWLAGVVVAALGFASLWPLLALAGAGAVLGSLLAGARRDALLAAILTVVALVGVVRYQSARLPAHPGGIALLNGGSAVALRGTVIEEPTQQGRSQRFPLRVETYRDHNGVWQPGGARVLVTTHLFPRFAYGDRLELDAKLEEPPSFDRFDYREYLARHGIVSLTAFPTVHRTGTGGGSRFTRALLDVRRPLSAALGRSLPEPEAALAQGILLGERASIPRDLTDDLNRAGISHLVAISGFNVMLVAGFAVGGLAWLLGRRHATFAAMALIVLFALFVGASPSVLRAVVMGEVMLGASLAGRPGSALTAVLFAGAVLSLWQPLIVDDVSFQLSFGATLGIVILERPLRDRLLIFLGRLPGGLGAFLAEQLAVTLAATVFVLPVIATSFGRISLVSLPANVVTVPTFPLIMLASTVTAVAGSLSPALGRLVGELAYLPLAYLVAAGRFAASLPLASVSVSDLGTREALLVYAIVALLAFVLHNRRGAPPEDAKSLRLRPVLALGLVVFALAGFVWWHALSGSPHRLRLTVLDVGQGDSILIQTPDGRRILVDGGPSGPRLTQDLGRDLPASARRFDLVVATHNQDDHITGLIDVLQRYKVGAVLQSPIAGTSAAARAWRDAVSRSAVPVHEAVAGEWSDLGGGARLQVLNPQPVLIHGTDDDLNNNCVVLRLVYGRVSFLLTCDIEAVGEKALLAAGGDLHSTVLKVGHHGSDGSSSAAFLRAVRPAYALISVGADNTYGHPSPTTLLRLAGVPTLRTDQNGQVQLTTDGRSLWVQPDRGSARIVSGESVAK